MRQRNAERKRESKALCECARALAFNERILYVDEYQLCSAPARARAYICLFDFVFIATYRGSHLPFFPPLYPPCFLFLSSLFFYKDRRDSTS